MATLSGSFAFLLLFGGTAVSTTFRYPRLVRAIPVLLMLIWLAILPIVESQQRLVLGDILARYLLCVPGAFLTTIALFSQARQFRAMKLHSIAISLMVASGTTLVYGVLAGSIVKPASFFPASVLNYETFVAVVGVPVQIFRAACAVVLACSAIHILDVFRWETQEALRISELRYATVASALPVFLFMTDREMAVTFAQGKGLDVLGLPPERIHGRPVCDVFPSTERFGQDCRRVLSGQDLVTAASANGTTFEVYCSALRDPSGRTTGIVGVALDISAKVRAQKELEEYRLVMERQARQAAVGALSATMAHQLAEPLSVARLVLEKAVGDLDISGAAPTVRADLARGFSAISRAYGILERFAETTQPTAPAGARPVGLYQIARRMMGVFAESAAARGLTIAIKDLDVAPLMPIPPREVEQVFYHLIQWAVDAAEPGRRQSLTIRCATAPDRIELRFSCGGLAGRAHASASDTPFDGGRDAGQGLGLAIVRRIVEDHAGAIRRDALPAGGTTFTVSLPGKVSS